MLKNRKILAGGLNSDDTDFVVGENEYINAENIRWGTTDNGSIGHIEPIGSNVEIPYILPAGINFCIGRINDEARRRIIYFNWNSIGDHGIYAYDEADDTTRVVLLEADVTGGLGFDKNYLIHSGGIVGDLAIWTDNLTDQKCINTEAGIKLYDPAYVTDIEPYTTPIAQSVIALIRKPPARPPLASKTILGGIVNNVADFAGQFAYRYIYRDNQESVLSPISELVNYNEASGALYDAVNVTVDVAEFIEQDVQIVEMCVRYGNSGQFYVIDSWNRDNIDDLAEINNHNASIYPLQHYFKSDRTGRALGIAYSIKQSDAVPLLSKTLELADNRVFLGNNLSGYGSPTKSSLAYTLTQIAVNAAPWQNPVFKSGGIYQIGIRFRDDYKRQIGSIYTNKTLRVQIPERDWDLTPYTTYISATLSNADYTEIPGDARYYDLLITKNLKTRFFVQGAAQYFMYAIKDATTGVITFAGTYSAVAYGLAVDISSMTAFGMGYTYQEGDVIRVFSTLFTDFTAKVLGQQGKYVIVQLQDLTALANPLVGPYANTGFEIYTPYAESEFEFFYTYGRADRIDNYSTAFRSYDTLGLLFRGDTYIRSSPATSPAGNFEYMSSNDKHWKDWFADWGEGMLVSLFEQVRKETSIQWSNQLIQGSRVNGLSTFDSPDEKTLSKENGAIQKLVRTNKIQGEKGIVMLAICETETVSMYLGEIQMVGSASSAFVASTPGVIGSANVLKGSYGTLNAESVFEHNGNVFWFDVRNGAFVQYSINGLDIISDFKLRRFARLFANKLKSMTVIEIEEWGNRPFVFGMVDKYHNEAMWSLPRLEENPNGNIDDEMGVYDFEIVPFPYDFYDGQAKTIVYKIGAQKWVGAYSHYAEMFGTIGSALYSFKNGVLWRHNDTASKSNFYGVQHKAKISLLCNADPLDVKTLLTLAIEANTAPSFVHIRSEFPYVQSSDIKIADFDTREGVHYAPVLRDRLSPGYTGTFNEIMFVGDKMRNTAFRIFLEWDNSLLDTDFANFKVITFMYNKSMGHAV